GGAGTRRRRFLCHTGAGKWRVVASASPSPGDGFGSSVTFAGNGQIVIGAPGIGKIFVLGQNRGKPAADAGLRPAGHLGASLAALGSNGLLVGAPSDGAATGGSAFQVRLGNHPSHDGSPPTVLKQPP